MKQWLHAFFNSLLDEDSNQGGRGRLGVGTDGARNPNYKKNGLFEDAILGKEIKGLAMCLKEGALKPDGFMPY